MSVEMGSNEVQKEITGIMMRWGLPYEISSKIWCGGGEENLCENMIITSEGDIYDATDQDDLKEKMLDYIQNAGAVNDIDYIFVNGKSHSVEVDIKFVENEE